MRKKLVALVITGLMAIMSAVSVYAENADSYSQGYDEFRKGSLVTTIIKGYTDVREVGETLELNLPATQAVSYQWYRSTEHSHLNFTEAGYKPPYDVKYEFEFESEEVTAIPGATGETYTLTEADVGYYILCEMKGADWVFVTDSLKFPVKKGLKSIRLERSGNTYRVVTEPEGAAVGYYQWLRKGVPYYCKDTGEEHSVKIKGAREAEYTVNETDTEWLNEYNAKGELTYSPKAYYLGVVVMAEGNEIHRAWVRIK